MSTSSIVWTRQMLWRFKKAYFKAVKERQVCFMFDGHEFVTDYAKYLISFLANRFADGRTSIPTKGKL